MTTTTNPTHRHPFTHVLMVEDLVWERFDEGVCCDGFSRLIVDGAIEFADLYELAELPSKIYDPIKRALDLAAKDAEESDRREWLDFLHVRNQRRG